jgi:hypothetical protein
MGHEETREQQPTRIPDDNARQANPAAVPATSIPDAAQALRPSRLIVCVVAGLLGLLIAVEPRIAAVPPSLQRFQAGFLVWFWVLFMFGGGARDRPSRDG